MADTKQIMVPDIGDFEQVEVIEVLVAVGDKVAVEDELITLESDKAAMPVPATEAGLVKAVHIKVGDKVSQGDVILELEVDTSATVNDSVMVEANTADTTTTAVAEPVKAMSEESPTTEALKTTEAKALTSPLPIDSLNQNNKKAHASPAVRKFARSLGVDISNIAGSGRKGRVSKEDVESFVKQALQSKTSDIGATANALPSLPVVDFAKFGEITTQSLSRIKKISGVRLHASWVNIPHVTQFDQADITELEVFRQSLKSEAEKQGVKLTFLAFLIKACVVALQKFPEFNASLDASGENLVLKHYYHIGIAVDTPDGLVVPVIRDADSKGLFELASELMEISQKARAKKLAPADMQGGSFSISSLGGIGGTAFTPIINAPEVAILGVSKASQQAVYDGQNFQARLILPLSLSYDHRVIDGALGARFTTYLGSVLTDIRRALL